MWKLVLVAGLLVALATPARADELAARPVEKWIVYAGDALLTRPAALGVAVAGAAVYAVTLPFTYWSRDSSAFDVLVRGPAEVAFTRCLGCTIRGRTRLAAAAR